MSYEFYSRPEIFVVGNKIEKYVTEFYDVERFKKLLISSIRSKGG